MEGLRQNRRHAGGGKKNNAELLGWFYNSATKDRTTYKRCVAFLTKDYYTYCQSDIMSRFYCVTSSLIISTRQRVNNSTPAAFTPRRHL